MQRIRRRIATVLLAGSFLVPLPGCSGAQTGAGFGALAKLALGIGASVGSYLLIQELD